MTAGRWVLESWVDQGGQKRSKHSVRADSMQMMDSKGSAPTTYDDDALPQNHGYDSSANMAKQPQKENASDIPDINVEDDDIPF